MEGHSLDEAPFFGRSSKKRITVKHVLWGILFCLLVVLIILVGALFSLVRNNISNTTPATSSQYSDLANQITSSMDNSANPCNDFYQYSCGSLISNTNLPPGASMYTPTFNTIMNENYQIMYDLVNGQWPLINDLYTSCMNTADASTNAVLLSIISQLQVVTPANAFTFLPMLHRMGVDAFFVPSVLDNIFQTTGTPDNNLLLNQAGISLPVSYYSNSGYITALAKEIQSAVSNLIPGFTLARATNVANFEKLLASYSYQPQTIEEELAVMTLSQLNQLTNMNYTWYAIYINAAVQPTDTVLVSTPPFFGNLTAVIAQVANPTLIDYLTWRVVLSFAYQFPVASWSPSLDFIQPPKTKDIRNGRPFTHRHSLFNFEHIKNGLFADTAITPQSQTCIDVVDTLLGDFLGLLFSLKVIDDDVIEGIQTVTGGVQNSFYNALPDLTWIDTYSKQQASYKLKQILQIIGHPNLLDRYRGLELNSTQFMANIIAISEHLFDDNMANVGTPFDRTAFEFSATVVNAFYSPLTNTINFPAGILESPMFSTSFPVILQYARMGYVIGHETVHGFDNTGRLFNAQGMYQPIMDDASNEAFNTQAQCIVDQFDQFQPVPGYYVNGEQTLGENIADLGGVKNAYKAYKAWTIANGTADMQMTAKSPIVPSLTNDQLFFVLMAQTWCTKATDAAIIRQLQRDPHAPSQYRVNGPLANFDTFSSAFSCAAGSPMNPTNKCNLW